MQNYSAYGMTIQSEIALPELVVIHPSLSSPDVTIDVGVVSIDALANKKQVSPYIWVGHDSLIFEVPGIARYSVANGQTICIQPLGAVDEASIRVFLLGSGFGALLFQRGHLVLHGNAIEIDGRCLICLGPSGIGKSTLTAAFMQRGYRVLADDVVPVDGNGCALAGFPRIKLWQDVADHLQIDTGNLARIRPQIAKYNLPLAGC